VYLGVATAVDEPPSQLRCLGMSKWATFQNLEGQLYVRFIKYCLCQGDGKVSAWHAAGPRFEILASGPGEVQAVSWVR